MAMRLETRNRGSCSRHGTEACLAWLRVRLPADARRQPLCLIKAAAPPGLLPLRLLVLLSTALLTYDLMTPPFTWLNPVQFCVDIEVRAASGAGAAFCSNGAFWTDGDRSILR